MVFGFQFADVGTGLVTLASFLGRAALKSFVLLGLTCLLFRGMGRLKRVPWLWRANSAT